MKYARTAFEYAYSWLAVPIGQYQGIDVFGLGAIAGVLIGLALFA